jgi:putative ABC transport system substrate-binding protein
MKATSTIPIIGIDLESDPVANGWVKSLARPGGNFTGLFLDIPELSGKQIELLKNVVPTLESFPIMRRRSRTPSSTLRMIASMG